MFIHKDIFFFSEYIINTFNTSFPYEEEVIKYNRLHWRISAIKIYGNNLIRN